MQVKTSEILNIDDKDDTNTSDIILNDKNYHHKNAKVFPKWKMGRT